MEYIVIYGNHAEIIILQETNEIDVSFIADGKSSREFNFLKHIREDISAETFADSIKYGVSIRSYEYKNQVCPECFIPKKHGYGNDGGQYVFVSPIKNYERDKKFLEKVGKAFHEDFDENDVHLIDNPFLLKNYKIHDNNFNDITVASSLTGVRDTYFNYTVLKARTYVSKKAMFKKLEEYLTTLINADLLHNNIYVLLSEKEDEKSIEQTSNELKDFLVSKGYEVEIYEEYNFNYLLK